MYVEPGGGIVPAPKPSPSPYPKPAPTTTPVSMNVDPITSYGGPTTTGNSGLHPWDTDPAWVAAQNSYNTFKQDQDAWLRAQRASAQAAFNGVGNQSSYMAQLMRADADRIRAYKNSLAARGILSSGEYGYQAGQEAQWRAAQQYAGEQKLLANLNNYLQQYTGNMRGAQNDYNAALNTAYQNYLANPESYGHWSDPNSPAGWFPFTPNPVIDPRTGASLITEYTK